MIKAREPVAGNAGVWGSLDGTTLTVEEPFQSHGEQNALYDGYTCSVCLAYLFVWAPDGTIVRYILLPNFLLLRFTRKAISLEAGTTPISPEIWPSSCVTTGYIQDHIALLGTRPFPRATS